MARFRFKKAVSANGVRVEKTDHGWRVYYHGDDPATRYLSPDPKTLARLKAAAERDYERKQRRSKQAA